MTPRRNMLPSINQLHFHISSIFHFHLHFYFQYTPRSDFNQSINRSHIGSRLENIGCLSYYLS